MKMIFLFSALAGILGLLAFIRLAPSDPARWHVDPGTVAVTDCADLTLTAGSARVSCLQAAAPAEVLARLDRIAMATPRTTRLAGSADSGRITWVTRSWLWGFPDYTTAQAVPAPHGTRLDVLARLRFGGSDLGVNAARLKDWLGQL